MLRQRGGSVAQPLALHPHCCHCAAFSTALTIVYTLGVLHPWSACAVVHGTPRSCLPALLIGRLCIGHMRGTYYTQRCHPTKQYTLARLSSLE